MAMFDSVSSMRELDSNQVELRHVLSLPIHYLYIQPKMKELTAFEIQRLENIKKNQELLKSLGIGEVSHPSTRSTYVLSTLYSSILSVYLSLFLFSPSTQNDLLQRTFISLYLLIVLMRSILIFKASTNLPYLYRRWFTMRILHVFEISHYRHCAVRVNLCFPGVKAIRKINLFKIHSHHFALLAVVIAE